MLQTNKSFDDCQCALNGNYNMRCFGLNNALMLVFAFAASRRQTLLLHASLVRQNGYGYAFIAKSGTGKSTHVSMWLRHLPGCDLMNDDNPIVRFIDVEPYIYGCPWSGKTPCYRNVRARLGAITRIDRAPHNAIEQLDPIEAFASLLPSCSSMKWGQRHIQPHLQHHHPPRRDHGHLYLALPARRASRYRMQPSHPQDLGLLRRLWYRSRGHRCAVTANLGGHREVQFANAELLPAIVQLLNEGHTVTLNLRGYSMRPFLEDHRDKALLTKAREVHVGDPVLAEIRPTHFVLHRVVAIDGEAVTLRGDGNIGVEHCRLTDVKGAWSASTARAAKRSTAPTAASGKSTHGYGCGCCPCAHTCWPSTVACGYRSSAPASHTCHAHHGCNKRHNGPTHLHTIIHQNT
jgi:hypothetical protein